MPVQDKATIYCSIIESIFFKHWAQTLTEFTFDREELAHAAAELNLSRPKNLGDITYTFRYRKALPERILATAPRGKEWVIQPAGHGKYRFALVDPLVILPDPNLIQIKLPDATPGIVGAHALSDEQALLAKIRYNRLIDVFTGITCYSLQNHLRTHVPEMGQTETDELYLGLNRQGAQFVIPVQAKGHRDRLSRIQVEQDIEVCKHKFPNLICLPIGAFFVDSNRLALFSFAVQDGQVKIASQKQYQLSAPDQITADELKLYQEQLLD